MYKLREIMNYTRAKIKYMKIPKAADIAHARTKQVMKEILKIMQKENLDRYEHYIEKFMAEEEFQDYTIMDVAAAFLSREIPDETFREIEEKPRFTEMFKKKKGNSDRKNSYRHKDDRGRKDNFKRKDNTRESDRRRRRH
jgi:ATP-dependent RNA helicase DeaD